MQRRILKLVVALCAVAVCGGAVAAEPAAGSWGAFNTFRVVLTQPAKSRNVETFQARLDRDHGDFSATFDRVRQGTHLKGSAMMIGSQVFAYRGKLGTVAGQEETAPYEVLVRQSLAMRLLAAAYPDGYAALQGVSNFAHAEPVADIRVAIGELGGTIPAPWKISGTVERVGENAVAYRFVLTSGKKGADAQHPYYEARYEGEASIGTAPAVDEGEALAGWTLPHFQPPAMAGLPGGVKTVGDVHTVLAEWAKPGAKDAGHDYAGFWSMNCEQPAGMRISHFGEDGIYALSMCLKGRCTPDAHAQKSFLAGDVKFHILGDDAIEFLSLDGRRDRYQRCNR